MTGTYGYVMMCMNMRWTTWWIDMIRCNMIIWLIEMDKYDMVYLTDKDKWTCYGLHEGYR